MKIRWTHGSIRFRIAPGELAALAMGRELREEFLLPGGSWLAVIRVVDEPASAIAAEPSGAVVLKLADGDLARLSIPETEGVYFKTAGDPPMGYYIEKDFPCAHPVVSGAEEQIWETFAPPAGFGSRHTEG